ncbi:MAG: helix-turn-helix transcriptional regulator [Rhizobiaceae bacterium]
MDIPKVPPAIPVFPQTGFVRLSHILAPLGPIPVSKSTWWQGIKDGRFPKPRKLGPRTTVWRAEDIRRLYEDYPDQDG